ncbi:maker359 [Drosophila busckii]|uniref:Maker359 n=1 Tax=Drosophila busckii TaxID=30019 RepID=A0A0M4EVA8_DROBS|nr:maker359 [Drosophila busckii]
MSDIENMALKWKSTGEANENIPPFSPNKFIEEMLERTTDLDAATENLKKIQKKLVFMLLEGPWDYNDEHMTMVKGYYDTLLTNKDRTIDKLNAKLRDSEGADRSQAECQNCVNLENRLEKLTKEFADMQENLRDAEFKNSKHKVQVERKKREHRRALDIIESRNADLNLEIGALNQKVLLMKLQEQKLNQQLSELGATGDKKLDLNLQIDALNQKIESMRLQEQQLYDKLNNQRSELDEKKSQNVNKNLEISALNQKIDQQEKILNYLRSEFSATEAKNLALMSEIDAMKKEIGSIRLEENQLNSQRSELDDTMNRNVSLSSEIAALNQKVESMKMQEQQLNNETNCLRSRLVATENMNVDLNTEITALNREIGSMKLEQQKLSYQRTELSTTENKNVSSEIAALNQKIESMQIQEQQLKDHIINLRSGLLATESKNIELNSEITALNEESMKLREQKLSYQPCELCATDSKNVDLNPEITALNREIESSKLLEQELSMKISYLQSGLVATENKNVALNSEIDSLNQKIESMRLEEQQLIYQLTMYKQRNQINVRKLHMQVRLRQFADLKNTMDEGSAFDWLGESFADGDALEQVTKLFGILRQKRIEVDYQLSKLKISAPATKDSHSQTYFTSSSKCSIKEFTSPPEGSTKEFTTPSEGSINDFTTPPEDSTEDFEG